jgi:hypothetical protein
MANIYINSGYIRRTGDTVLGDLTMASGADILFAVSGNNSIGSSAFPLGTLYVDTLVTTGVSSSVTASNIGTGIGLFSSKVGQDLQFKSIIASGNIVVESGTNALFIKGISVTGGSATASNTGTGYGWYSHQDGSDLVFKSVTSGNNITIGSSAGELQIGVNNDPSFNNMTAVVVSGTIVRLSGNDVIISGIGLGSGEQVYSDIELNALRFKSLLGAGSISLSSGPDSITISGSSVGSVTDGFNTGTGYGWFLTKTGTELAFKTITSGNNITIGSNADDIQIGVNDNPQFVSVGAITFSGNLFSGNFISGNVISAASSLRVNGNDVVASVSNVGGGEGFFASKTANTLNLKTLAASGSITISSDANTVYISGTDTGEVNTASNVGIGVGVFKQKSGVDLQFKSLVGSGLTVSSGTDEVFLSVQDVYVNVTGDTMTGPLRMSGTLIYTNEIEPMPGSPELLLSNNTNGQDFTVDFGGAGADITLGAGNTIKLIASTSGVIVGNGTNVYPETSGTQDLGSPDLHWGTIYVDNIVSSGGAGEYVNVTGDSMTGNLTMSGADILTSAANTNNVGSLLVPFAATYANAGYFNIISGNTALQVKNYQNVIDIITPSGLNLYSNESANAVTYSVIMASGATTSNANFDLQTISIPTDSSCLIESRVVARRTGGSAGTAGDGATYVRTVMAKNIAGTVTLGTIQASYTNEDQAAWNATFVASSPNVLVRVNGEINNNINWHVTTILQRTL